MSASNRPCERVVLFTMIGLCLIPVGLGDQPPGRRPPGKSDASLQRRPSTPQGIRPDAHIRAGRARQVADISYFRMNRPQVISGLVADVQQGRLPRQVLKDVATPRVVDSLLATRWSGFVPERLANTQWRSAPTQRAGSRNPQLKPLALYTSDQMAHAQWSKMLTNVNDAAAAAMKIAYSDMVAYSPNPINLGTFPYYQTKTAVLAVTSPTEGAVTASWKPSKPVPKIGSLPTPGTALLDATVLTLAPTPARVVDGGDGFTLVKMVSYTGTLVKGSPQVDKTVSGGGPLPVKAGQDFIVVLSFKSPYPMGGSNPILVVKSDLWSIEVPVLYNVTSLQEYSVSASFDEPLANLVSPWQPSQPGVIVAGVAGALSDGSSLPFGVTVKNTGDKPVTAKLEAGSLPTGITLDPVSVALAKNESKHTTLTFKAAPGSPTGKAMPGTVKISYAKDKVLTLALQFTVRESYVEWSDGWDITDKVSWTTSVFASSAGAWHWTAHLKDHSTWYGDAFVVGFYFNAQVEGLYPGREETGTLGAKYSGPPTNYWIDYSGVSPKIQSHWPEVYDNGVWFFGNAYGDLSAVVEWLAKTGLKALIGAL